MQTFLLRLKKRIAYIAIFSMMFTLMPISSFAQEASDISGHWAKDKIQSWIDKDMIKGYPDGTFKPDQNITRAEFMSLVNSAFGYTNTTLTSYSDVASNAWYFAIVGKAQAANYITGYPDGTMKPDSMVSREEAATIIARIKNLTSDPSVLSKFSDSTSMKWSKDSINAVSTAKIMKGYPDGTFMPGKFITRAEVVFALDSAKNYEAIAVIPPVITENGGSGGGGGGGSGGGGNEDVTVKTILEADVAVSAGSIVFNYSFATTEGSITYGQAKKAPYYLNDNLSTVTLANDTKESSAISLKNINIDPETGIVSYTNLTTLMEDWAGLDFVPTKILIHLTGATSVNSGADVWVKDVTLELEASEVALLNPATTYKVSLTATAEDTGLTLAGNGVHIYYGETDTWVFPEEIYTDIDGVCSFDLPNGEYMVEVIGFPTYENSHEFITVNNHNITLSPVLNKYHNVNIDVVDTTEAAIIQATITVYDSNGEEVWFNDGSDNQRNLETDGNGDCSFNLTNGNYTFDVSRSGYADQTDIALIIDDADSSMTIVMEQSTATLYNVSLTATAADTGLVLAGTDVHVYYRGTNKWVLPEELYTDIDGVCSFDLPNGKYTVEVIGYPDYENSIEFITINNDNITLSPTLNKYYNFEIKVIDPDQAVVSGAAITIYDSNGDVVWFSDEHGNTVDLITDETGYCSFSLINGDYTFDVSSTGYADQTDIHLNIPDVDSTMTIMMDYPLVTINVTDALSNPISEARIIVFDSDGKIIDFIDSSGNPTYLTTDELGQSQFYLTSGDYTFSVDSDTFYGQDNIPLKISNENVTLPITLEMAYGVTLTTLDSSQNAITGAAIYVSRFISEDENGLRTYAPLSFVIKGKISDHLISGTDGTCYFGGDSRDYLIDIKASGYTDLTDQLLVVDNADKEATFVLTAL